METDTEPTATSEFLFIFFLPTSLLILSNSPISWEYPGYSGHYSGVWEAGDMASAPRSEQPLTGAPGPQQDRPSRTKTKVNPPAYAFHAFFLLGLLFILVKSCHYSRALCPQQHGSNQASFQLPLAPKPCLAYGMCSTDICGTEEETNQCIAILKWFIMGKKIQSCNLV